MTGYTVHTGATKKFSSSWGRIFGDDGTAESGQKTQAKPATNDAKSSAESGEKKNAGEKKAAARPKKK